MSIEETAHLQELIEIHKRNLQRLQKQAAHYGNDIPLKLQNDIEFEEKEIKIIEIKLLTNETMRQIKSDYKNQSEHPYFIPETTLFSIVEIQIKLLVLLEELAKSHWMGIEADAQIEHLAHSSDRNLRIEILLILVSAIIIQSTFESVVITLTGAAILWSLLSLVYTFYMYIPVRKRAIQNEKETKRRIENKNTSD